MNPALQTATQINTPQVGEVVPIKYAPVVLAPDPKRPGVFQSAGSGPHGVTGPTLKPETFNLQPATNSLTEKVMGLPATEPFIGSHEMFHVEMMGELAGHFTRLGRALERKDKSRADRAHILALAEELTRLAHLECIEGRASEDGIVRG